jgi:hypothetical protein
VINHPRHHPSSTLRCKATPTSTHGYARAATTTGPTHRPSRCRTPNRTPNPVRTIPADNGISVSTGTVPALDGTPGLHNRSVAAA